MIEVPEINVGNYAERISGLLATSLPLVSQIGNDRRINRWGSRIIVDGSRVQLAKSQRTIGDKEYLPEHSIQHIEPADDDMETVREYSLEDGKLLTIWRVAGTALFSMTTPPSQRTLRQIRAYDHPEIERLLESYTAATDK
jgi:hypothetical protein